MSDADSFFQAARVQVLHWTAYGISLGGFSVSPHSVMEYLRSVPLSSHDIESTAFKQGFAHHCLTNAERRRKAGNLSPSKVRLFVDCSRFWLTEFPVLAERTRATILFEINCRLERAVYGEDYGASLDQILGDDNRSWDDWDFI